MSEMGVEMIKVQLPDGSVKEVARGTTPLEIAEAISPRLAAVVVVARVKPLAGLDINTAMGGPRTLPPIAQRRCMTRRRIWGSGWWICPLR